MKNRETYDTYSGISVSREVREFLTENAKEQKRYRGREYAGSNTAPAPMRESSFICPRQRSFFIDSANVV